MKKRLIFFLTCVLVFINCTHTQAQQPTYRNNITKAKDSSDYRFKNTLYLGYNFYTFDNTGTKGLYPTALSLYYRHSLPIYKNLYYELGWNFFDPSSYEIGFEYMVFPYAIYGYKFHTFHTLRAGIGTAVIPNKIYSSLGLCYKYGSAGEIRNIGGVGSLPITFEDRSTGLYISLNYQWQLGKRFVIEPTARYEYYFEGVTSHYMIGLNAGYKF
jgi:hypothetical protein